LTRGIYIFGIDVTIGSSITFQGTGTGTGTGIGVIQILGNLEQTVGMMTVLLTNGALPKKIFCQVAGKVIVGDTAHLEGILLVQTKVTFKTGSSLNGRVFAQTACNLQVATIPQPSA
jgi:hypothetical protein